MLDAFSGVVINEMHVNIQFMCCFAEVVVLKLMQTTQLTLCQGHGHTFGFNFTKWLL